MKKDDPNFSWDSEDMPPEFRIEDPPSLPPSSSSEQAPPTGQAPAHLPDRRRTYAAIQRYLHGSQSSVNDPAGASSSSAGSKPKGSRKKFVDPAEERERQYMARREREEKEKERAAYEKWKRKQLGLPSKKKGQPPTKKQ